jgi:signal transduction histidine kinase
MKLLRAAAQCYDFQRKGSLARIGWRRARRSTEIWGNSDSMPVDRKKTSWPVAPPPWRRSLVVLAVIFVTEYSIMFALPWMLPAHSPLVLEAAVDAVVLTSVVLPVLLWTVVRPLQQAARIRDHFLADLFLGIEDERRRIAHELHDGVGQTLTMLISGLRSRNASDGPIDLERREAEMRRLAQRALTDTKQLARGLRPGLLDDLGLAAAIERVAAEIAEHQQLQVAVDVQQAAGKRLPQEIETALFRIFQEAMANITRHSEATVASIRLSYDSESVILHISDNGRGIDAARSGRQTSITSQLGLVGMQERAALLGGAFSIESPGTGGTNITVTIPFRITPHE